MEYFSVKQLEGGWVFSYNCIDSKVFTDSDLLINHIMEVIRQQEANHARR